MSVLTEWIGFGPKVTAYRDEELPHLFDIGILQSDFVRTDIREIFSKILTDVVERTEGISDKLIPLLWDNCLQSNTNDGLISLLAIAMSDKQDLFIVYNKALGTLRKANSQESEEIRADYVKSGKSSKGVFVSFKNYRRSDMIKFYSAMEYNAIAALAKSMNLSKAIQFKMSDMRASVSLLDADGARLQAIKIAKSLSLGRDVMLDAKDAIESHKPDLVATKESITFIEAKRCFYLSMPLSYVTGEQTSGIGASGEADTKAIERGLKNYYFSIIKPVVEAVFGIKTTFKSHDFRMLSGAMEALKTFELVGEEYISRENKLLIINNLFVPLNSL